MSDSGGIESKNNVGVKMTDAYKLSNRMKRAAHGLSLPEKRLVMLCVAMIDKKPSLMNGLLEVKASDYAEVFDIPGTHAYRDLKAIADDLFNRHFTYQEEYKGEAVTVKQRWVSRTDYCKGHGFIRLRLCRDLKPYILKLKSQYTLTKLKAGISSKSVYTWRLHELINSVSPNNVLSITVDELRRVLEIPESYVMGMIKKRVINPSIKDLELDTTRKYSVEYFKRGRRIHSIRITWHESEQGDLFKSPPEKKYHGLTESFIEKHSQHIRTGEGYEEAALRIKAEINRAGNS